MKKQLIIALFFPILLSVGGCQESFHYISSQINSWEGKESSKNQQDSSGTYNSGFQTERTKIDELSGTLLAFNGARFWQNWKMDPSSPFLWKTPLWNAGKA